MGEEYQIVLPWIVLPPEEGKNLATLLISAPDGQIIKLLIRPETEQKLKDILPNSELWATVFIGLVSTLEMSDG